MSVSSTSSATAALQRQLVSDQRTLAADTKAKASAQVLAVDQAKVSMDQTNLAAASQKSTPAAGSTAAAPTPANTAKTPGLGATVDVTA